MRYRERWHPEPALRLAHREQPGARRAGGRSRAHVDEVGRVEHGPSGHDELARGLRDDEGARERTRPPGTTRCGEQRDGDERTSDATHPTA